MNLQLLASIPQDGYAIMREGDSVFLLRPPYDLASRVVLRQDDVHDAVLKHGFNAEDTAFASYADLIDHLERQLQRSREESGIPVPDEAPLREALALAPPEVIRDFLRRTEIELIPDRKWDQAEDLLINILAARTEDEFRRGALKVRDKLRSARQRPQTWQPPDARFKTPESKACKSISQAIRQSGHIFQPVT